MKMLHQLREIHKGLDKVRTGWTNRNIPQEIAETVLQQSKKVAKAASIYGKHCTDIDIKKLVTMALTHDFAEYKEKDYIPGEITKEEKHRREKVVMMELKESMGEKGEQLFNIWMEHEQGETKESQIVHQLDKLDAAIQAMEYEKLGHDSVKEFYPYTLGKLTDPVLMQILEFLLKKEYLEINTYDQYFLLLEYNGDEELFKERIEILLQRKITQN